MLPDPVRVGAALAFVSCFLVLRPAYVVWKASRAIPKPDVGGRVLAEEDQQILRYVVPAGISILLLPDPVPRSLGLVLPNRTGWVAVGCWTLMLAAGTLVLRYVPAFREIAKDQGHPDPRTPEAWARTLRMWVAASFCEEVVYRAFVFSFFEDMLPGTTYPPIFFGAAWFAMAHAYQGFLGILHSLSMGLLLAQLYLVSGRSLLPVIACHLLLNLRVYLVRRHLL